MNSSSLRSSRKKPFLYWTKPYFATIIFGALLGTYLDLFFVGKQIFRFPIRPFPEIFSINIGFTLVVLPAILLIFIFIMKKLNQWGRVVFILFVSILAAVFEKLSEAFGLFVHSNDWKHIYTVGGYFIYLTVTFAFFQWMQGKEKD